jgi:hypothetical protein
MVRNNRKTSTSTIAKISHVYDTLDNEKVWLVKMNTGKKQTLTRHTILKKNLLTEKTTWSYLRVGCKCRFSVGEPFRYVFWKGFVEPTQEPVNFSPWEEDTEDELDSHT